MQAISQSAQESQLQFLGYLYNKANLSRSGKVNLNLPTDELINSIYLSALYEGLINVKQIPDLLKALRSHNPFEHQIITEIAEGLSYFRKKREEERAREIDLKLENLPADSSLLSKFQR